MRLLEAVLQEPPAVIPLLHSVSDTRILLGGLSRPTVLKLCKNRELVSRKIGTRRMILRSSILAFLKKDHPTLTPEMREIRSKAGSRK
jgi:Helix-turn-helix domain